MKLMYARCCGKLIVPNSDPKIHTQCECGSCACWWDNPFTGDFAIWVDEAKGGRKDKVARVIGIHNGVLTSEYIDAPTVQTLIEAADGYIFKSIKSLIANIVPGFTKDTRYANNEEHTRI